MEESGPDLNVPAFNCAQGFLSESQFRSLPLARGVTAGVCFLLCVFTLFLICYHRTLHSRLQRFFFYLTVSTIAYLAVLTMHLEHYFNYLGRRKKLCIAVAFLDQYTGSVQLLFTLGIAIYLVFRVFGHSDSLKKIVPQIQSSQARTVLETLYIITSVCLPLLFVWIPFVAVPYGETGPWCWIQSKVNCSVTSSGYLEEILIWYIPFALVAFSSPVCVLVVLVVFCKWRYVSHNATQQLSIKETLLVFSFLVANSLLCAIEIAVHTYSYSTNTSRYFPLMAYAISTPIGSVIIPIAFLIYIYSARVTRLCNGRICCRCCYRIQQRRQGFVSLDGSATHRPPSVPVNQPSESQPYYICATNDSEYRSTLYSD